MITRCIVIFSLFAALLTPMVAADDVDVSGDWVLTLDTPRGPRTQGVRFVQEGNGITATPLENADTISEGSGTIDGNKITWSWSVVSPRGTSTVTFVGTVSGDTMSGSRNRNRGQAAWTAKRQ